MGRQYILSIRTGVRAGLLSALLACTLNGATAATPGHGLVIRLAPQVVDGRVDAVAVTETFDVAPLPAGALLLSLPIVSAAVPGVLRDPATLHARDDAGPLALEQVDDPVDPSQMQQDRHWRTRRPTAGKVTVEYLARPRVITADTRPAALKDMRTEGQGIHGSTKTLFAIPATGWPRKVRIEWDLSAMAPGSRAVTSFGEGDVDKVLDAETLSFGYFMAGPWRKFAPDGADGFSLYYLTAPDFDLEARVREATATYDYANKLFGTRSTPMRAFMRTTERFQGGGTGGYDSFMFGTVRGKPFSADHLRYLLAHESLHHWILTLPGGKGVWFTEGATDYLATILPYRLQQVSPTQIVSKISKWTSDYYANPRRTTGDEDAVAAFWTDVNAQVLTYARGALYIALVDARLRKASGGNRRVDDLIRAMVDGIRRGDAGEDMWLSLVTRELGEQGRRDFADMKAGRLLDLPPDLFGPCFRRVAGPVGRFRPGFEVEVAADGRRLAGPVRAGSPAAAAGLAEGAEILDWRKFDEAATQPVAPVSLRVRDGAGERMLRFDPWVSVQDGYTWVVAEKPPAACGL